MRRFKLWGGAAIVLAVIAGCVWAYWNFELRWRPQTIVRHQGEIARLLQNAGWVSPPGEGRPIYLVSATGCEACRRYRAEQVAPLIKEGLDPRVIVIARRDENGQALSTPADRAATAQLWLARDWSMLMGWDAGRLPPGLPTAEADIARRAIVEAGRSTADRLDGLLEDNDVDLRYPLVIWWNARGEMRACACDRPQAWRFVRRDLRS